MTPSEIRRHPFDSAALTSWGKLDPRYANWPVVYVIDDAKATRPAAYVGETVNAANRMKQHLDGGVKSNLRSVRIIVDETFNKSVCLDLESHLIRWLAGDGNFTVMNRNEGMIDADYYGRDDYRQSFREIFEQLRNDGVFTRTIPQIENSDLFKLSPFKSLTVEQASAVSDIADGLFDDLGAPSTSVIEGQPGTGKTIVAIFLIKLLMDIQAFDENDDTEPDSIFAELFTPENRDALRGFRIGLVVPQQSLRASIKKVFRKTPQLNERMVMSQWDVGKSDAHFDLLIVDEAHRLNQRANQSSGVLNRDFRDVNAKLYGADDLTRTQLDWILTKSTHRLLMLDREQTVRPADLPREIVEPLLTRARGDHRYYRLATQMRVRAGADYVGAIRGFLRGEDRVLPQLGDYDFRVFDNLSEMRREIVARDAEHGLARLVAGYAWKWVSRKKGPTPNAYDISLDGVELRWNRTDKDWINSPTSLEEVGSIHTTQGYDLNYAGVIIGPDLRIINGAFATHRDWIFDAKAKENNNVSGRHYTDQELRDFVTNIYGVLLTRGVRGTYVYACDAGVRARLRDLMRNLQ